MRESSVEALFYGEKIISCDSLFQRENRQKIPLKMSSQWNLKEKGSLMPLKSKDILLSS